MRKKEEERRVTPCALSHRDHGCHPSVLRSYEASKLMSLLKASASPTERERERKEVERENLSEG